MNELPDNIVLSVCIPVYNGSATIAQLVDAIHAQLQNIKLDIVLVNDGSRDNSEEICTQLAQNHADVRFIGLRRNFGEHNTIMCALAHSRGDYAVIMSDDLQDHPSEVIKLLKAGVTGVDVVYTQVKKKRQHWFRNFGSWFNNLMASWVLEKPYKLYLSSFKLISRGLIDEIIKYKGPFPYIDGLILRSTNSIIMVPVEHHKRRHGKSNYTLKKLVNLWLNMFINFSQKPLHLALITGLSLAFISFFLAMFFVIQKILDPTLSRGWASIITSILFIGGVQLIFLGLLGEYIGKIYMDMNKTPQWVIKTKIE